MRLDKAPDDVFIKDVVPSYDLIVMDEIASILKQFGSHETFKNRARSTYEYLVEIMNTSICNGGKIISMDGDLGNRAMLKQIWQGS